MQIIKDFPPNIEEIKKVFPIKEGVIFAWGDKIYNPSGFKISEALLAHEEVHGMRQGSEVELWWDRYLVDPAFRLQEEIPAHQAEWKWFLDNGNRHERRAMFCLIAERLSSDLYGKLIKLNEAKALLREMKKS